MLPVAETRSEESAGFLKSLYIGDLPALPIILPRER